MFKKPLCSLPIIKLKHITIYPQRYFIPFNGDEEASADAITSDTHTIHWFSGSWVKPEILYFLDNKHIMTIAEIEEKYEKEKIIIERMYRARKMIFEMAKKKKKENTVL